MRNAPDDFDWHTDPTVAVRQQAALAVYGDNDGQVTIRQQGGVLEEGDHCVTINCEHVPAIIRSLLDAAGLEDIRLIRQFAGGSCEDFEPELRHRRPDLDVDAALAEFDAKVAPEVSEPAPKDKTGAERQKRLREKRRNGGVTDTVTPCVTADGEHSTVAATIELVGAS